MEPYFEEYYHPFVAFDMNPPTIDGLIGSIGHVALAVTSAQRKELHSLAVYFWRLVNAGPPGSCANLVAVGESAAFYRESGRTSRHQAVTCSLLLLDRSLNAKAVNLFHFHTAFKVMVVCLLALFTIR